MRKKINVPFVLQMENVECGAASLAMILRYFGKKNISLEQLRTDCSVSKDGVTAKGIKEAAIKNGLICKAFKATPENIKKVNMPAIIHWNMSHFVVLCGYSKKYFYINDPSLGKYKVGYDEFNKSFTGIVLTFEKSEDFFSEEEQKSYIGFTISNIKKYIPKMIFLSFVFIILTVCCMLTPFFNSAYINNILLTANSSNFKVLIGSFGVVSTLTLFSSILGEKLGYELERNININLSVGFMEKIIKLPITFFHQRTAGELANRQLGSFEIANLVVKYITPIFFCFLLIIIYCIIAFMFNVYIALVGIVSIILNVIVVICSSAKLANLSAVSEKNEGLLQSSLASCVDMIETIKSCACEDSIFSRLTGINALNIETKEKIEKINIYSSGAFYFINLLVSAIILIIGVYEILDGEFLVGTAVGVLGAVSAFLTPVGSFINSISAIFNLRSIAERTDDTMKYKNEDIFLSDDCTQVKLTDGSISAKNVSFCYNGSKEYAVRNINFNLEKGKSIAFVGESGSGKSTVAKLIGGLYSEKEGNIFYGNATKKELKKEYFYSKIAVVSQSVKLYDGTVFENITMWDKSITYDEVVLACKKACIHNEIVMRNGAYYEKITESGKNFSGGQRQRIEIARAVLRKPEILILDEATSNLDAQTEKEVFENINSLGITLVIVSHRLSTIKNCSEILVLKNGEIIEKGTHSSLEEKKGFYFKLVSNLGG